MYSSGLLVFKWMNNYPWSLISNIIENIGIKKVFTKLDL